MLTVQPRHGQHSAAWRPEPYLATMPSAASAWSACVCPLSVTVTVEASPAANGVAPAVTVNAMPPAE